jgi:hypothetical protein
MPILRSILIILLTILLIHLFEVASPRNHAPAAVIPEDTLLVIDSIQAMQKKFFDLEVEELFWKNRIAIAREPSFILTADMQDSMITIDMQGVPLHRARISGICISRGLDLSRYTPSLLKWLDSPFRLRSQTATIPKEPIQERYISSRRDAETQLIHLRDPEDSSYVSITMEFDRNLTLIIKEAESDSVNRPLFSEINISPDTSITVYISRIDALALYRALPEETGLVLRM